jgi:capsular polysaccharide transport system permease protein
MSDNVSAQARSSTVKQLRRMRLRRIGLRLGLGVVLPTVLSLIYYGLFVTPRYESVTTFTIQSADTAAPAAGALQLLMSNVGSAGRDVLLVEQYIRSRDMLQLLLDEHDYRAAYATPEADFVSRLDADASFEEVYDFYLDHITVEHDSSSGALTLRVQAFDAASARRLGRAILDASEAMVNQLSASSRDDRMALAQAEMERAEARLSAARTSLRELQSQHGDLNPLASAEAVLGIRSRLEGELAIARAELSTLTATMPRGAAEIVAARRRVSALREQIDEQNQRMTAEGEEGGIHAELAEFEPVVIEKEFAQRAYESALSSLELARVDAGRQHRYLVLVSGPSQPEEPAFPRVWYSVLTVLALSFALLGVGTLLIASIREHANV